MSKFMLSISGGGCRGLIPLYILLDLERDLMSLYNKGIYEFFDFYTGTSVGSIITSIIVYSGHKRIQDIIDNVFSETALKQIFTKNTSLLAKLYMAPKYSDIPKHKLILKYLDTDITNTKDNKHFMCTAYSVSEQKPRFFKSYGGSKYNLAEVINAGSNPPNYFPSGIIDTNNYAIDGAVFQNNPCDSGYCDILKIFPNEEIRILSLGCGASERKSLNEETSQWGLMQWVTRGNLIDTILELDPDIVDYRMQHFTNALGHRYVNIDGIVNIALDDITQVEKLKEIGHQWYKQNREKILNLFKHE